MSMKHTPGPWEVVIDNRKGREGRLSIRKVETFESVVYQLDPGTGWHMDTHKANARLIAAAPELLEVCKAVFSALNSHQAYDKDLRLELRAIIERAEGK